MLFDETLGSPEQRLANWLKSLGDADLVAASKNFSPGDMLLDIQGEMRRRAVPA
jgi:hypothetical protein